MSYTLSAEKVGREHNRQFQEAPAISITSTGRMAGAASPEAQEALGLTGPLTLDSSTSSSIKTRGGARNVTYGSFAGSGRRGTAKPGSFYGKRITDTHVVDDGSVAPRARSNTKIGKMRAWLANRRSKASAASTQPAIKEEK